MERVLLAGARLLDPEAAAPAPGSLLIEAGRIAARLAPGAAPPGDARVVDLGGRDLAPGLIDLHFHGTAIFAAPGAVGAALADASRHLLASGVTAFLPTTVAWPEAELSRQLDSWCEAVTALHEPADGAAVLGLHLEGPWIRSEAAGAQPRAGIRPYRPADAELFERAGGLVRMVTLAPEAEGAEALLAELTRRGVVAALGHTLADAATCEGAVARGAQHATHLFNAMGPLHHRAPGLAGTALGDDRLSCDLICDGVHVAPAVVRLAARAKGARLALITDNVEIPRFSDRENAFANFGAGAVHDDGVALRLADGTLAGSRLRLDEACANAVGFGAFDRLAALRAATLVPARLLGVEASRGTLRAGARADLVVLDAGGRSAETWLAGRLVHRAR
jgi:N-acetylglucosamine-6-phosphate deacetylase